LTIINFVDILSTKQIYIKVLQQTSNHESAKNLRDSLSLKLGLEVWQLFTVLTVIFSISSSFMWLGLVNPRNIADKVNNIDRSKAFVYNRYQQDLTDLSKIEINQSFFDQGNCSVTQKNDNVEKFKKIDDIALSSQLNIKSELERMVKSPTIFENNANISTTYMSYLNVANDMSKISERLKGFQVKKSDLLNKALFQCQNNNEEVQKQDIIDSVVDLENLELGSSTSKQLAFLKAKIADKDINSNDQLINCLLEINDIKLTVADTLISMKVRLNEFESNIKKIEAWEGQVKKQNPNINAKIIYIYDV
jgi:hypothetical protein